MFEAVTAKTWQFVVIVLIVMAFGAMIECQFHLTSFDDAHATPSEHRHASSTHAMGDSHCLIAVLPAFGMFASFLFYRLHTTPLVSKHTGLVSPPFIPPRYLML